MDNIEFIEASEKNLNLMLEVYNYYIENTSALFDFERITLEEFKNRVFINHYRYKTFLIHVNNEFAGFCFLTRFRKKKAYDKTVELGLYLKPQFTGRGLGSKIVKYLEGVAKKNQFDILIASISGENIRSIKLFKKLAYEQCAHYKGIAIKLGRKLDIIDFQKAL